MIEKTLANYGAPFSDTEPVADPTKEQSATQANRALEDLAQLTRTGDRVLVVFTTRTSNGSATVTLTRSMFTTAPTVSRTATGTYTVTLPATVVDGLNVTETVGLLTGDGAVLGPTCGFAQTSLSGSPVASFTVYVFDSTGAASDLSGTASVRVTAR